MAWNKELIRNFINEVIDEISGDDEITLKVERPTVDGKGAGYKSLALIITQFDNHIKPVKEEGK